MRDLTAALDYLLTALPIADRLSLSETALIAHAQQVLHVCHQVPWGDSLPDELFLPYVLCPRIGNEAIQTDDGTFSAALLPRIQGLTMTQAALAVNLWCCEQVHYQSTDDRTLNARSVFHRGFGRCGEESTFVTAALRAVGLPARQVYVPYWSHCDDNHAWVEVYADGQWHHLGACEPEPTLDSGWYVSAASKAMLIRAIVYGATSSCERTEWQEGEASVINRTAAYGKTTLLTVTVSQSGSPLSNAEVTFELANEGAFRPLITKKTNQHGQADLLTGLGSLHLTLHYKGEYRSCMVNTNQQIHITVDFSSIQSSEVIFHQQPPAETRIQPLYEDAAFAKRLSLCEKRYTDKMSAFQQQDTVLEKAGENASAIASFLANAPFSTADKQLLLSTLPNKDFADVTADCLTDALTFALPHREAYPEDMWAYDVLCPRIGLEQLTPYRADLCAWLAGNVFSSATQLYEHLQATLALTDDGLVPLLPTFSSICHTGLCPANAFEAFFVACARSLGFAARINSLTQQGEIYNANEFHPVCPMDTAVLSLCPPQEQSPANTSFSISYWENGRFRPMPLPKDRWTWSLPAGEYRLVTCTRQIDGSIDGRETYFSLLPGDRKNISLLFSADASQEKLLRATLPPLPVVAFSGKTISLTPPPHSLICILAPEQEPSQHALNELLTANNCCSHLLLIVPTKQAISHPLLKAVCHAHPQTTVYRQPDPVLLRSWRQIMQAGDLRLPFTTAIGAQGQALFSFVNYHVGAIDTLLHLLSAEKN